MPQAQRSSTFIWLLVVVFSAMVALVLTFTTADYARRTSAEEARKIEMSLGPDTLATVNDLASGWYFESVEKFALPMTFSEEMARAQSRAVFGFESEPLWRWLEKRAEAFLDLGYWFLRRLALFVIWLPMWIPMMILAALHGWWDREIKKTDFGYTSPVLNHWARNIMHCVTMMTLILFVLPVAIDPILFPAILMVTTIMAGVALGNVQKRI